MLTQITGDQGSILSSSTELLIHGHICNANISRSGTDASMTSIKQKNLGKNVFWGRLALQTASRIIKTGSDDAEICRALQVVIATYHIVIAFETLTDAQILGKCFEIQAWDPKGVPLQVIILS